MATHYCVETSDPDFLEDGPVVRLEVADAAVHLDPFEARRLADRLNEAADAVEAALAEANMTTDGEER